jgi:hypothetical protein
LDGDWLDKESIVNPVVALIGGIMKRGVTMSRCYYVCLILLLLCGCIQAPTINESGVVDVKHIEELLPFHSCVYKVNPIDECDNSIMIYGVREGVLNE